MCEAIRNKMASAISFPSGENLLNVIQGYDEEWGFPMCGAVDGTHIPILAPNKSQYRDPPIVLLTRETTI